MLVSIIIIKLIIVILFLFSLCVLRSKIYLARSLMNLKKIYKITQKTLAQRSSFVRQELL